MGDTTILNENPANEKSAFDGMRKRYMDRRKEELRNFAEEMKILYDNFISVGFEEDKAFHSHTRKHKTSW